MRRLAFALVVALTVAGAAGPARAQSEPPAALKSNVVHTVQAGDTLELLAAEFYGDRLFATFIMAENRMTHPRPLRSGEKLRIPTAWKYSVVRGETLDGLAGKFLGDARRAPYLADFNGLAASTTLGDGQKLTIPFHVRHVAADKETLASLAATFYGDSRKAELLRGYNFLQAKLVKKGEELIVPISHVRVRDAKLPALDAASQVREQKTREEMARARDALPEAREAWRAGAFGTVKRSLATLDPEFLESDVAAEVGFLLGSTYVAFGDEDSALANFKKVLERKTDFVVRSQETSPKIRRVWERAGGKSVSPAR
jgi:LysM repeat protein